MKRLRLIEAPDPTINPMEDPVRAHANTIRYADLIREVVRQPLHRQNGATIDEMRQGIRILDALDRAVEHDDVLELEDADHAHLVEKVRNFPWAFIDRRLLTFAEDVELAKEHLPSGVD